MLEIITNTTNKDVEQTVVKSLIRKLKRKEIDFYGVPEELRNNAEIVALERKLGIRKSEQCGFDVINDIFFVIETIMQNEEKKQNKISFDNFDNYYDFLDGDIYKNSCYYQYDFTEQQIEKYNLDLNKLSKDALIEYTIDDFSLDNILSNEADDYKSKEKEKMQLKRWIDKVIACNTAEELKRVFNDFYKSEFSIYRQYQLMEMFISMYVYNDPEKAFNVLMDCINTAALRISGERMCEYMCFYYSPQKVLDALNYNPAFYAASTVKNHRNKMRKLIKTLLVCEFSKKIQRGFDIDTHYFYEEVNFEGGMRFSNYIRRYFETFDEFVDYLGGNLGDCDLSKAILPNIDFSKYVMNDNTKFPEDKSSLSYSVEKKYSNEEFEVVQKWTNINGKVMQLKKHEFYYFFDFVHFLKGDLSDADLILCDGLYNLTDVSMLNFSGAKIRSNILDKFQVPYEKYESKNEIISFDLIKKNEEETELILKCTREEMEIASYEERWEMNEVSYITDIHLLHKFVNCKSKYDVDGVIRKIAYNLLQNYSDILLIGGDVSSDFTIFTLFVKYLREEMEKNDETKIVIFILGNHELWDFPGCSVDSIIETYKKIILDNGMYFLQNSILYKTDDYNLEEITENELTQLSMKDIRKRLRKARLVIFGGIGFAGYNEEFNANVGIYREILNREQEIEETKRFEKLYNKITDCIYDKNTIIFTHMPKIDWSGNDDKIKGFIYVSGHTHKNYFDDDGEYRVYSDNQIGYTTKEAFAKVFFIDGEYDWFSDYTDGIYKISNNDYNMFYRGKNIRMDYNRDGVVCMLKKMGYYCFVRLSSSGRLSILNGGALKSLSKTNINYYYENMEHEIAYIRNPFDKYTEIQKKISYAIREIGGSGYIHGTIVDIDYFNHIYINPFDLTVTGYHALDKIDKYVYSNIPSLLKAQCPVLYANYEKRLKGESKNALIVKGQNMKLNLKPQYYPNTDIYEASREIRKMQKLKYGILTTWHEPTTRKLSE